MCHEAGRTTRKTKVYIHIGAVIIFLASIAAIEMVYQLYFKHKVEFLYITSNHFIIHKSYVTEQ